MVTRIPGRIGGLDRPLSREEREAHDAARAFQSALRKELLTRYRDPESRAGRLAAGYADRVIVRGVRAQEAMRHIEHLVRRSRTFRAALDEALAANETIWITIGHGGGYSRATIGAGDERIWINLDQGDLLDLLIHECGHALAKLPDGEQGEVGPNQRFQAIVKREMEEGGAMLGYGLEVRPRKGPVLGG